MNMYEAEYKYCFTYFFIDNDVFRCGKNLGCNIILAEHKKWERKELLSKRYLPEYILNNPSYDKLMLKIIQEHIWHQHTEKYTTVIRCRITNSIDDYKQMPNTSLLDTYYDDNGLTVNLYFENNKILHIFYCDFIMSDELKMLTKLI